METRFKGFGVDDCESFRAKLFNLRANYLSLIMAEAGTSSVGDDPGVDLIHDLEDHDLTEKDDMEVADQAELEAILDAIQPEEVYGDNLLEKIAQTFDRIMKKEFSETEVKEMKESLKIPDNARALAVPKIPRSLWKQFSGKTREADLKGQFQHQAVSRALVATAKLSEFVFTTKAPIPKDCRVDLTRGLMDIAKNLSIAAREINVFRRHALRDQFKPDVAGICSSSWEPSEYLIPEDLEKEVKNTRAANSVMKNVPTSNRFQPYVKRSNFQQPFNRRGGAQPSLNYRGNNRYRGGGRGSFRPNPSPWTPNNFNKH